MVPGKLYRPEDYLEVVWRRRWTVAVPVVLFTILSAGYVSQLPSRYRSEALILVIPPRVAEAFVRSSINDTLTERLASMQNQLLSRSRLERIVLDFDLYPKERRAMSIDDVLERMRQDVKIDIPRVRNARMEPSSFKVAFIYEDARTAKAVTDRLASLFVQENLEDRAVLADTTSQFLQSQVEEALRKLQEHDAEIERFRRANQGRLPTEVQTNLQLMQTTQQQVQTLIDSVTRDRERQMVIERTLAEEVSLAANSPAPRQPGGAPVVLMAGQELEAARATLLKLRERLTEEHPDIRAQKRRVAELEAKAEADALQQPVSEGGLPVLTTGDLTQQRRLSSLRVEFESLERGIAVKRKKIEGLERVVANYRERAEAAPSLESRFIRLMQDRETLANTYTTLLRKTQDAQVSANLEQRQIGQQFTVVDPPRIPDRPTSPNRPRMLLIGMMLGLGFGLALCALLEYRDTSLRTEQDVIVALSLPVVALVPRLWTSDERLRQRRWRVMLIASSVVGTLLLSIVAVAWRLRLFDGWAH